MSSAATRRIITDPVAPRMLIALHRLADAARILRDAGFNERQDAALNGRIKLRQRLERRSAILNSPSQDVF